MFQTFTTVGYGVLSPSTTAGNCLVMLESVSRLSAAVVVTILYHSTGSFHLSIFVLSLVSGVIYFKVSLPVDPICWCSRVLVSEVSTGDDGQRTRHPQDHVLTIKCVNLGTEELYSLSWHCYLLRRVYDTDVSGGVNATFRNELTEIKLPKPTYPVWWVGKVRRRKR